jgi:chitinase
MLASPFTLCLTTILCYTALFSSTVSAAPLKAKVCNAAKRAAASNAAVAAASVSVDISIGIPVATPSSVSYGHHRHSHTSTVTSTAVPSATSTGTSTSGASTPSSTSSGSHFVIYTDQSVNSKNGLPAPEDIKGFNVLAISFLLASGPADQAQVWAQMSSSERKAAVKEYNDAGISLIVSAFGETESPVTDGVDPVATANKMAQWVIDHDLQGIDVDFEDFDAFNSGTKAQTWLITFTKTLRAKLPAGQYTISHAPVAPWFSNSYKNGGYLAVDRAVGDAIDWYNIQFYNQGSNMYTDCEGLLTTSGSAFPKTSVMEIAQAGVDINKIVIGKPGEAGDASNGFISQSALSACVAKAQKQGWNAGVMSWEFPSANAKWATTVRGAAFALKD